MKAYHVMLHPPVVIHLQTPVPEIAHLMAVHRLNSLPVVDEHMRVLGLVSEADLSLSECALPFSTSKEVRLLGQWIEPTQVADAYQSARHYTAADVMTHEPTCVDANDEMGSVALLMARRQLIGVPVLRKGKLVGFIERVDLIRPLARIK